MGYYEAKITESVFVVEPDAADRALQRMLELSREDFGYDLTDRGLQTLDEFLRLFSIITVREGDRIVALEFEDRLMLETEDVFRELAPSVGAGSFVRMHSGTGQRWRYEFDGEEMTTVDEPDAPWYGR